MLSYGSVQGQGGILLQSRFCCQGSLLSACMQVVGRVPGVLKMTRKEPKTEKAMYGEDGKATDVVATLEFEPPTHVRWSRFDASGKTSFITAFYCSPAGVAIGHFTLLDRLTNAQRALLKALLLLPKNVSCTPPQCAGRADLWLKFANYLVEALQASEQSLCQESASLRSSFVMHDLASGVTLIWHAEYRLWEDALLHAVCAQHRPMVPPAALALQHLPQPVP